MLTAAEQETVICQQYINKVRNAKTKGHAFELTYAEFKRLKVRKCCAYTGVLLTQQTNTLERIDNSIGYTKENTIACHSFINALKGGIENPNNEFELKHLSRMLKYLSKK